MTTRKWSVLFIRKVSSNDNKDKKCGRRLATLVSALILSALVAVPLTHAVGLGEITVSSSLNEPLDATIQVLNAVELDDNQLLVSLASPEAFERGGVTRDFFLNQLQFSLSRDGANQRIINIVTEQPVVSPYLDVLVQLQWPEGRVMREYTLLLDLPIYSQDQSSALQVAPPVSSQSSAAGAAEADLDPLSGDQHRVIVGDTLWNVAKRLRPRGATILQTMDSLYQQNSRAFADGDANRLMEGSVLRLPSTAEIRDQVGGMVALQIGLRPSLTDIAAASVAEQGVEAFDNGNDELVPVVFEPDDGRLELVSALEQSPELGSGVANESLSEAAVPASDGLLQLSSELAIANDEMNKVQRENAELRERMLLLEAQVATMAEMVTQAPKVEVEPTVPAASSDDSHFTAALLSVPVYAWAAVIAIVVLLLVLLVRRSSIRRDAEELDELPVTGYEADSDTSPTKPSDAASLLELEDLELDPDDNLFDETDTDIFDGVEETVSSEIFDMMVEAVAEAEVFLSLGNVSQAIDVLEEARSKNPADASSRLKLMEILFREGRKDELSELYEEILLTEDSAAIDMAAIIAGPQNEAITSLEQDAAELELDDEEDSPEPNDSPELGEIDSPELADSPELTDSPELADLELEEVELEDLDADDLDLDALDIEDFDIDLDDEEQADPQSLTDASVGSESGQFPGSEELDASLADATAETALEEDDFTELDDLDTLDSVDIKLDLAKTYLEMGDPQGAREILEELIEEADKESDDEGRARAEALLNNLPK